MNENNNTTPTKLDFKQPRSEKAFSILKGTLACMLVGITVFLCTYFPMQTRYERDISSYKENYILIPDHYDAALLETALGLLDSDSIFDFENVGNVTEKMIEAVISAMGDRYGTFFTDVEYAEYTSDLAGNFVGIGVSVSKDENGNAEVVLVHAGSPAEEGDLLVGDVITAVGDITFASAGYETAFSAISGEEGTEVTLTILRGSDEMTLTFVRSSVVKQTVVGRTETYSGMTVGYVLLTGFDGHTFEQFKKTVSEFENSGVDAFIFDVRSNGGGLLSEIGKVLSYLLPDGTIAYVDYASDDLEDYTIENADGMMTAGSSTPFQYAEGGHQLNVPAVVLCNGGTASAAELFTSALRDYATPAFDSAVDVTIVGTLTYGKGTVQTTYRLGDGCALKLSVARYNPPSNVNYDGVGITPDYTVELTEEQSKLSILKRNQSNDPQLVRALEILEEKTQSSH